MVKICLRCRSTWAGGQTCEDCGGELRETFDGDARSFPRGVWAYIRLQYGARRGMLVRVMALLLGPVVAALLLRLALSLDLPWSVLGALGAVAAGVVTWWGSTGWPARRCGSGCCAAASSTNASWPGRSSRRPGAKEAEPCGSYRSQISP